jgi:catalase
MHHFQQDGHMAFTNPRGRVNYEPNSWGAEAGPREDPLQGFTSFAEPITGEKMRVRSETFADHYSQATQFYISQTPNEQKHIRDALVFELSKVERPDIRERMVGHLLNVDADLGQQVATKLGLAKLPPAAKPAMTPRKDLKPSPKLSIVKNGPNSFKGRKAGVLLTDGVDAALFAALKNAIEAVGGMVEVIAPAIGGVKASGKTLIPAQQKLGGGPSVLYDAVAVLGSDAGIAAIANEAAARDFVNDAFAHCKFIAYNAAAVPLFESAGIAGKLDKGCFALTTPKDIAAFLNACKNLRLWEREESVNKG